jgi:hypothetical protein
MKSFCFLEPLWAFQTHRVNFCASVNCSQLYIGALVRSRHYLERGGYSSRSNLMKRRPSVDLTPASLL